MVLIIAPMHYRNLLAFGSLSPYMVGRLQIVDTFDIRYILVNLVKNLCFNMNNPYLKFTEQGLLIFVNLFAKLLGANLGDISISEGARPYAMNHILDYGCDTAINSLMMLSLVFAIIVFIIYLINNKNVIISYYPICAIISFVVFFAIVRWENYVTRYEIAYFAIISPFVIYLLNKYFLNKVKLEKVFFILITLNAITLISMFGTALYTDIINSTKPRGYFNSTETGNLMMECLNKFKEITKNLDDNICIGVERGKVGDRWGEPYIYPIIDILGNKYRYSFATVTLKQKNILLMMIHQIISIHLIRTL